MFFFLSKLLKFLIYPFSWIVGLFIASYFVKNRKWKKGLFIASMSLLIVFSNKPLLQTMQYASSKKHADQALPTKHYKVAIIMGGYSKINDNTKQLNYYNDRGERLWEPVRLYHSGIIDKLMVSGDPAIVMDKSGNSTADAFLDYMEGLGVDRKDIILEQHARNSQENAVNSVSILDSLGYKPNQCLLVTSATHMKRSLACFKSQGWDVDAYAVNIYEKPHPKFIDFVPNWETLFDWNELTNEWVGNLVYKIVF